MSTTAMTPKISYDEHYALSDEQIAQFRRDGFIKLKDVFTKEQLDAARAEIVAHVAEKSKDAPPLEERNTYGKAFLQIPNLWEECIGARDFIFGKRLARIATELMGTSGVRMYHDQALFKEPGGGFTPWHVDQYYWPLDSDLTVTAWIPLHAVPMENGPLEFSVGSQKVKAGRELAISDESEEAIEQHLKRSDFPTESSAFDLGEVSFHYGWTFHRAGPNTSENPREIMTVIYMDKDIRLLEPKYQAHENDLAHWLPGCEVGEICDGPKNPILYEHDA